MRIRPRLMFPTSSTIQVKPVQYPRPRPNSRHIIQSLLAESRGADGFVALRNLWQRAQNKEYLHIFAEIACSQDPEEQDCICAFDYVDRHVRWFWNLRFPNPAPEQVSYKDGSRVRSLHYILQEGLCHPNKILRARAVNTLALMLEGCVGLPSHKDDDWPRLFVDVVFDYLVRSLQTKFMGIDGVAKAISQYLTTYEEQKLLMLLNSYAIRILVCLDGPYSGYPPYAEVDERMTLEPASQARILSIARTILETAYIHRGKRDIDNTIKSWIPLLAKTCYRLLARKPIPGWDSFLLDQQIYESLPLLLKLPQYVPEKIPMIPLIRATANQLLGLCSVFVTNYVHSGPDGSQIPTSTIAEKPAHLPDVMCPAFEFLSAAIRDKRPEVATYFANESHINDLITCVFQWSLLCRSDEYDFERHPERFVFPNEEQQRDSLRACASELLTSLLLSEHTMYLAASSVLARCDEILKQRGKPSLTWKDLELCMAVLDSQTGFFNSNDGPTFREELIHIFNASSYLDAFDTVPYLRARLLLHAGIYVHLCDESYFATRLGDALRSLTDASPLPVKLSALVMLEQFYGSRMRTHVEISREYVDRARIAAIQHTGSDSIPMQQATQKVLCAISDFKKRHSLGAQG